MKEVEAKEEVMETQDLPLKSELLKEQKELEEKNKEDLSEMQKRTYTINVKNAKVYKSILKFLEKDAPWSHTTGAGLVMLYSNLKENKEVTRDPEWEGDIELRTANVSILWQMLTRMTGSGFFEARRFIEIMAAVGESTSEAHNMVMTDNHELRENHSRLSKIDDALVNEMYIDDTKNEEEE